MMKRLTTLGLCLLLGSMLLSASPMAFQTVLGPEDGSAVPGSGSGYFEFDPDANTLLIDVNFTGLLGVTTVAHIHCCVTAAGTGTAGVAVTPATLPGFPIGVTSGAYSVTLDLSSASTYTAGFLGGSTPADPAGAEARLLQGILDGKAYFNVHTDLFPAGEIRGFLAPVPEPATFLLTGLGILGLWSFRRR